MAWGMREHISESGGALIGFQPCHQPASLTNLTIEIGYELSRNPWRAQMLISNESTTRIREMNIK
eukprot:2336424-Pyramimonas_sp.AAC.1